MRSDHNLDDTAVLLESWCSAAREAYLSVDCQTLEETVYEPRYPSPNSDDQYRHTATLQQEALDAGRRSGAQYFLVSFNKGPGFFESWLYFLYHFYIPHF